MLLPIGFATASFSSWITGEQKKAPTKLRKLAEENVSMEELIAQFQTLLTQSSVVLEEEMNPMQELISGFQNLFSQSSADSNASQPLLQQIQSGNHPVFQSPPHSEEKNSSDVKISYSGV